MHLSCGNVIWTKYPYAAKQRCLVEKCSVVVFIFLDEQLCHDSVNADMEGVERAPVMVENVESFTEVSISFVDLVFHVEWLHQDAVKFDYLGVQWVRYLERLGCEKTGFFPLLVLEA